MSNGASNRSFLSDVPPDAFDRAFRPKLQTNLDGCQECGMTSLEMLQRRLESEHPHREIFPHTCEECGKRMKYADQICGCLARRPGSPR